MEMNGKLIIGEDGSKTENNDEINFKNNILNKNGNILAKKYSGKINRKYKI